MLYMPTSDQHDKAAGVSPMSSVQSYLSTCSFLKTAKVITGASHVAGGERLPVHSSSHRQAVEQVREEAEEDDRDFQGIDACRGLRHGPALWLLFMGPCLSPLQRRTVKDTASWPAGAACIVMSAGHLRCLSYDWRCTGNAKLARSQQSYNFHLRGS